MISFRPGGGEFGKGDRGPLLVVILGPTGSGKTSLSVALGRRFDGEIVSCDSVAVYRGLEIGSAKPSAEQRELVPHHLLDVVGPDAFYTAGDYSRAAREAIAGIFGRGGLPIVTGGTGLYLRALLQGLFPGPQRSVALRERLLRKAETRGPIYLHRVLKRLDPASAARIHVNDTAKVIRAIEVTLAASRPMSEAWKEGQRSIDWLPRTAAGPGSERAATLPAHQRPGANHVCSRLDGRDKGPACPLWPLTRP